MSVERSLEAWEEVQRHGQDLADRLAQGFTGLIQTRIPQTPGFPWTSSNNSKLFDLEFPEINPFGSHSMDFGVVLDQGGVNGVSAILDIGSKIGQAGFELGANLNGLVQQMFRRLPLPFKQEEIGGAGSSIGVRKLDGNPAGNASLVGLAVQEEMMLLSERLKEFGFEDDVDSNNCSDGGIEGKTTDDAGGFDLKSIGQHARTQGTATFSSTFDSRTHNIDSILRARGDLWRLEAAQGSSSTGIENSSSLFLVQLGPILFVRDSTLLLPVHLSKQHLLWYGYDRKNGLHSLCPAVWSKHRRWLCMSMVCLNPLACSFVDLQFPHGQITYVSGEGVTASAFAPLCGGLLQLQGQYPGEMKLSYAHKNKWGTEITPILQWPDKSFSLSLSQALAWQQCGLMVKPTVLLSVCPTFGGSNPGVRGEVAHSVNEKLNLICGSSFASHPSVFASVAVGRSKWNGNLGKCGVVVRIDSPLSGIGRPFFTLQMNSGFEF